MTTYTASATDNAVASSGAYPNAAVIGSATSNALARTLISRTYGAAGTVNDTVNASSRFTPNAIYHLSLSSSVKVRDNLVIQLSAFLVDHLKVTSSIAVALACRLLDNLKVTAQLNAGAIYNIALVDRLTARSTVSSGLGAALVDLVKVMDHIAPQLATLRAITDLVEIDDNTDGRRLVIVALGDSAEISDMNAVEAIYHLCLTDCVMAIGGVEPEGGLTAWAINARSGGVTEYLDWPFNSYVRFGDRYVGASDEGVFELIGDGNESAPIVARVAGGQMQLTGSYLTGLDGVFVAIDGDGEMFLRLEGSRGPTIYRVVASSERTARIDVGKGWRSRYISWELVTTGQDFGLEGLEFVPVASQRHTGG